MKFTLFLTAAALTFLICSCSDSDEYYLLFQEAGKTGMINYKGDIILENEFKGTLRPFQSGQALYQTQKTNYFINKKGRESTDGFAQATDFNNGYAFVVNPGERISVINSKYKVKRKLEYDEAEGFIGKIAVVKKDGRYGAINNSFKEVLPCSHDLVVVTKNGDYILAISDNKTTVYNDKGKKLLETRESIFEPSEGLISYYDDGWGFLDMTGRKVIRARAEWTYVTPFLNGYSSYLEDGRWGVIDKAGTKIIRAKYDYPIIFNVNGIAPTAKREEIESRNRNRPQYQFSFGYINANDDELIPFKYKAALPFHRGKAFVYDGKYWFVIDAENKQYGRSEFQHLSADRITAHLASSIGHFFSRRQSRGEVYFGYLGSDELVNFYYDTRPIRVKSDFFDINGALKNFLEILEYDNVSFLQMRPDMQPAQLASEYGFSGIPGRPTARNNSANQPLQLSKIQQINNDISVNISVHYAFPAFKSPPRNNNSIFSTPFNYITHYTLRMNLSGKGMDKHELLHDKLDSAMLAGKLVNGYHEEAFRLNDIFTANTSSSFGNVQLNVKLDWENFLPSFDKSVIPGDYPEYSIYKLTEEDLQRFGQDDQDIIRNEIFARNGFRFSTQKFDDYFGNKPWYKEIINDRNRFTTYNSDHVYAILNPVELHNVNLLLANRKVDTVTDVDGNTYPIIKIGDQTWMTENLRTTRFRTGERIPEVFDNERWADLKTSAFSYRNNEKNNIEQYGNLYNWQAAADPRGICPTGWRVPSDFDWMRLEVELGMNSSQLEGEGWRGNDEGARLAGRADLWYNGALVNNSKFGEVGFNALPGGYRDAEGNFRSLGMYASMWSSTSHDENHALQRWMGYKHSDIYRFHFDDKRNGYSIRCLKDD